MDKRVFRMAILTIISAFILVLAIVYATNTEKINGLFGWGKSSSPVGTAQEAATEATSTEKIYGEQIGDNLNAFTLDDDFFDETEQIPSVVVIQKTGASEGDSSADASTEGEDADQNKNGNGMAVVGELQNPNPEQPPVDENGYLTTVPEAPPGGFGEYIPGDSVVGTP